MGLSPIIESIVTRNIIGQIKRINVANPMAAIEKTYNDLLPFIKFQINLNFFIIILSFSTFSILLNQFSKHALLFDIVKALSYKKKLERASPFELYVFNFIIFRYKNSGICPCLNIRPIPPIYIIGSLQAYE
jgi:hypothetical protein